KPNGNSSSFLLTGFPGLEAAHRWISTPFFFIYFSVLLGNSTLLLLIKEDHNLHEPMYYFLAMLAATDLGLTLTTMPTVLRVLWLDHREIGKVACFSQAYFIHSLAFVESGVLLAMAYDRFIAIHNPLRYTSILTNNQVLKIGLGVLMRGFVSVIPPILPLYFFPYCHSHSFFVSSQGSTMWSNISAAPFLLTGFPGLEIFHPWISISFFVVYVSILLGNGTLLFLIREDHTLHQPMYYFLALLAATDLGVTLTTMPTVLGVLWFDHRAISQGACYFQAYLIHSLSIVESGVLLVMAYDRFIAICSPLRYTSILTNAKVVKIGLGVLMRGFILIVPIIITLSGFPYCRSHVLSHAFCLHQDVIKLACADITFNRLYPIVLVSLTGFLDSVLILISYILILNTVMGIASGKEQAKALNTCVSHISCV
ncbi:O51B2 protein, partial [Crocuta crocuta]